MSISGALRHRCLIIAGYEDGIIAVQEPFATGNVILKMQATTDSSPVKCMAYDPEAKVLAVVLDNGELATFNLDSRRLIDRIVTAQDNHITCLQLMQHGERLLSGTDAGQILIIRVDGLALCAIHQEHASLSGGITCSFGMEDRDCIGMGTSTGSFLCFNVSKQRARLTLARRAGEGRRVHCAAFNRSQQIVAAGTEASTVILHRCCAENKWSTLLEARLPQITHRPGDIANGSPVTSAAATGILICGEGELILVSRGHYEAAVIIKMQMGNRSGMGWGMPSDLLGSPKIGVSIISLHSCAAGFLGASIPNLAAIATGSTNGGLLIVRPDRHRILIKSSRVHRICAILGTSRVYWPSKLLGCIYSGAARARDHIPRPTSHGTLITSMTAMKEPLE